MYSHGGSNMSAVTGGAVAVSAANKLIYYCSGYLIVGTTNVTTDTWHHCAFVGNGGADGSRTLKLYLDGTLEGSVTSNYNFAQKGPFFGANESAVSEGFAGWIDEVRISKGIQRWTANFTPPNLEYYSNKVKKFMGVSNV
jgi:hypothetical protein